MGASQTPALPAPRVPPCAPQDLQPGLRGRRVRGAAGAEPGLHGGALPAPLPAGGQREAPGGQLAAGRVPPMVSAGDRGAGSPAAPPNPPILCPSRSTCTPEGTQCQDISCDSEYPLVSPRHGTHPTKTDANPLGPPNLVDGPGSGRRGPRAPLHVTAVILVCCVPRVGRLRLGPLEPLLPLLRHRPGRPGGCLPLRAPWLPRCRLQPQPQPAPGAGGLLPAPLPR